jgi:tetratricopeptide (TPR) repeat protein
MHLGHDHDPAEENPELALKHYGRAIECLRAGNREKAVEELKRVLEYDPDFDEAKAKLDELNK